MPFIETSDGTPLFFLDEGPRRSASVVLIHAEPFSSRFWARNIGVLQRKFRVVSIDVRGRGESGKTDFGHRIAQYARDLEFLMDETGIERAVVVGWSLGGSIVWSHMEQFGNARYAGYVNVDQAPHRWVSEEHLQARFHSIRTRRLAHHTDAILGYFGPEVDRDDATVKWMAYECMKTPTPYHIEAVNDSFRSDFRPHMARTAVPTQVHWAKYGTMDEAMAEEMRRAIPDCELVYFETCGHMIPWVERAKFNDALTRFAARVLPAGTTRK